MTRILIVDDEPVIQRTLRRLLVKAGYECSIANNAAEARRELSDQGYPLVLCDVNMPGESGIDLVGHIFDTYPNTATVMVSAEDDMDLATIALENGAYGYIIKPFGPTELLINVYNALRRRNLEIENRSHRERLERIVAARTVELKEAIIRLEQADVELRKSREETIRRLAKAAEFRDSETGEHIDRISRYSTVLAMKFGLNAAECELIRIASPMHDVGKLGTPDRILLKPDKLSIDEFELMKTHTEIGFRILSGSGSDVLDLAATIARTHHERYDGSGYPRGLAGEDIPIAGRIVAIADVFDALTSRRVYKAPVSIGESVEMMRDEKGTHFDPVLLDLFVDSLPDLLDIMEQHPDKSDQLERVGIT